MLTIIKDHGQNVGSSPTVGQNVGSSPIVGQNVGSSPIVDRVWKVYGPWFETMDVNIIMSHAKIEMLYRYVKILMLHHKHHLLSAYHHTRQLVGVYHNERQLLSVYMYHHVC